MWVAGATCASGRGREVRVRVSPWLRVLARWRSCFDFFVCRLTTRHPTLPPSLSTPQVVAILASGTPLPVTITSTPLDLPELQGTPSDIARAKASAAATAVNGPALVEDTSLCFDALGGLPGPYVKWFLKSVGPGGLHTLLAGFPDKTAHALCIFAYASGPGATPIIFEGSTKGIIVPPRGPTDFGWDPVFQPDEGGGLTYAEMQKSAKNAISHRYRALDRVRAWLLEGGGGA